MRSERERLLDILEAIERIEKYARKGKAAFLNDELIQNWMVNHITMIGEASRDCRKNFRPAMPIYLGRTLLPCEICLFITILASMWKPSGQLWNAISPS